MLTLALVRLWTPKIAETTSIDVPVNKKKGVRTSRYINKWYSKIYVVPPVSFLIWIMSYSVQIPCVSAILLKVINNIVDIIQIQINLCCNSAPNMVLRFLLSNGLKVLKQIKELLGILIYWDSTGSSANVERSYY